MKIRMMACCVVVTAMGAMTAFGVGEEWLSYRQVERGTPQPIAGIVNADFEDSTKFGKSADGKSEYGRFGYNGNGGCRMWIREKFRLFRFPSDCKLKKGRTYTFSGMYRAVGNARGGYSWMMFVDGKYRREKGGIDVEDLGNGWKRGAVTFTPECDGSNVVNCLDFQATPLRKMSEQEARSDGNYIDFDNLQLVEAVPVWRFCNVWPIQNRVYKEGGRVRCRNSFVGDFFEKDAQPFYVVRLVVAGGRTLAQRLCRDKDGVFTCAFGDLAYEGPAELVVALYDRRNRLGYGEKRVPVTVVPTSKPANGRPFITEDGRTLVDGEPFMPLGFWTGLGQICLTNRAEFVRQLEMLHGAGFNAIVEYNGYLLTKKEDRDFFYDQCGRNGIRVFDGDMALASWDELNRKPDGAERYRAKSLVYRDYPAIFAWFVTDECSADRVPDLMAMRRILSETAPNIPMWPCNIFEPDPFLPGQDVQGGDLYPYRGATSTLGTADKSLAAFEACRPAACWHSPQCYNWQEMKKKQGISAEDYLKGEPDENQMLSVAVLMASRSVTGFLFYSHFNIWRPSPAGDLGPARWARMVNIARTMNALKPFITSGIRRVEVPHVDRGDSTRVVALSDGQGRSRLLVIGLGLKHDCEIDLAQVKGLAGKSRCGKTTLKDGKAVFRGTGISCDVIE